jgi:uncharacterized lipoprotein YajG
MTSSYPRETVEFAPITVKVDGVEVLTGVTVSIVAAGVRPTVWVAPTTLDGKIGVMVTGMTVGAYNVWAKVVSSPETPIIDCGSFRVT